MFSVNSSAVVILEYLLALHIFFYPVATSHRHEIAYVQRK